MMIDKNQSRLECFENTNENREISHRGHLDAEKEKKHKNNDDEHKWIPN